MTRIVRTAVVAFALSAGVAGAAPGDLPARHQHAVQYMKVPDLDWPKVRRDVPEEFQHARAVDRTGV